MKKIVVVLFGLLVGVTMVRAAAITSIGWGFLEVQPDAQPHHPPPWINHSNVPVYVVGITLYPYIDNGEFTGSLEASAIRISDGALMNNVAWFLPCTDMIVPFSAPQDYNGNWFVIQPGDGISFSLMGTETSGGPTDIFDSAIIWVLQ